MSDVAPSATSRLDTVVELTAVWKVYRQRQRSERLIEALRRLVQPRYRQIEALRGIDLRVTRGEIVAYAGPNGAGKSTTIKLLAGLLAPTSGEVRVLGMNPTRDRVGFVGRIGVVFGQRTELWWDQPVSATFEWKRVVWNIPTERYQRMQSVVRSVLGLDAFFDRLARELSLGQRMRADLGLALLHEPEILFLDEPTLGLDVLAKRDILAFIKELNQRQQVTVMVTSHDMAELEQLAGRIVMIHEGNLAFDGDFLTLRRQFADHRRLVLETDSLAAPELPGALLVSSDQARHEYTFDAAQVRLTDLLLAADQQAIVHDVETHRAPIEEVIAEIYARWQSQPQRSP